MDAALAQLLPQIKHALDSDGVQAPLDTSLADLLPDIRAAVRRDEAATGEDDERIAKHIGHVSGAMGSHDR
jgi:hypothetical protein